MANVTGTTGKDFIHVSGDGHVAPGGYTDNPGATDLNDQIDISAGGVDIVFAGDGNDAIDGGSKFGAADQIDGEEGNSDQISVDGDYSAGIVFNATTLVNVETLIMAAGHDYKFTIDDATIGATKYLYFIGSALGPANTFTLDASAETDGIVLARGGAGNDVFKGGSYSNTYYLTDGGNDRVTGGASGDSFQMGGELTAKDRLTGVGDFGNNSVNLDGDYSAGLKLGAKTLVGMDTINIYDNGTDYKITLNDATVAAGKTLTVDAEGLLSAYRLVLNGAADTDGQLIPIGGNGKDVLTGGAGDDKITGGDGKDTITPGAGADVVDYGLSAAAESTGAQRDTVVGFDFASEDRFDIFSNVFAVDAKINHGTLSGTNFDADMEAKVTAAKLGAHHAVLFIPDAGTLAGHTFVIVDANNVAGYQAGLDYVIELVGAVHIGAFDLADFF